MNDNTQSAIDFDRVKRACSVLAEYFDSVQIFTSKMSDNQADTQHYRHGTGNWFARYGQIKSWISDTEKGYILGDADNQAKNIKEEWE